MEDTTLQSASGIRGKKRKQSDIVRTGVDEREEIGPGLPSSEDSRFDRLDPITPAKISKKNKSGESHSTSKDILGKRTKQLALDDVGKLTTFSQVNRSRDVVNVKIQVVMLWYKNLYSQTRPKSITFVAVDTEGSLFEVVISDALLEKWAPRIKEGKVYIFKHLIASENEKKINVIDTRFQLNVTKDSKCIRIHKEKIEINVMLPNTMLSDLHIVRPKENYLQHFVVYVIDVRPLSLRTQKNGDISRFVEAYVVDESLTKIATVLTVWDNIYDQYKDLFGHGFTKPFVLTAIGLKVDLHYLLQISLSFFVGQLPMRVQPNFMSGILYELHKVEGGGCFRHHHEFESDVQFQKGSLFLDANIEDYLPIMTSSEYFTRPSVAELASREVSDRGYCGRVPDFVVGRVGYGHIRFVGVTDVRWMNLNKIVKFARHSVVVYENESDKPPVGHGLNKSAEVTLILQLTSLDSLDLKFDEVVDKLRERTKKQGAQFFSFDCQSGEWKFLVQHFSRFGLEDDEEDDTVMDEVTVQPTSRDREISAASPAELELSHSLPAHLGLDPVKMQEMRMLMFPIEEDDEELEISFPSDKRLSGKGYTRADSPSTSGRSPMLISPVQGSSQKTRSKITSSPLRKSSLALLEYNVNDSGSNPSRSILMTGQNKGLPLRVKKVEGFKLDTKHETPLSAKHAHNVVDAALFMGRSFRVGWGPNGVLVHTGTPVGKPGTGLSSVINMEKVALDRNVRDENDKVKEELVDLRFASLLNLHKSLDHETKEVGTGLFKLKIQKVAVTRLMLSEVCRSYIGILEKLLEVSSVSTSSRVLSMHQVTIWELIKVLFSERESSGGLKNESGDDDDGEDMMLDKRDGPVDIDPEASPFVRRAEFSYWLQDSVCHRVQEEVSYLNDSNDLEHILVLLTGRQLDTAVELAASRGDVRLAILLSQAGGSMVNRSYMAQQLELWRVNGLDFKYIESDRLKLYELLAGNIQGALQDSTVDWKRHLGLVMWYQLPPDTSLPAIVHTYQQLLSEGRAPNPVPVYVDEGPLEDAEDWSIGDRYDIAYYLMLLHANQDKSFDLIKTMFSALSSTNDPLDHHMIWHQRAILEAIGAFSSNDLNILDMSFVSQLLCLGQCHWAIYVVLHMTDHEKFPHIYSNLIREILLQYCETWSKHDIQRQFIEDLGIPSAWMHEALAIYFQFYGDLPKALEHFLECSNWQKAHSIFMTSVAHSFFLSSKHSEIWRITSFMAEHKSEIADWDLGAGIYIDFYIIKSFLQEEDIMDDTQDPLEKKNEACRDFFGRLNDSLTMWGSKLPIDTRATYSKMAEELCTLLEATPGESSTPLVQMNCFETMLSAPIPEDLRACHLQDALSVFTYLLAESAS